MRRSWPRGPHPIPFLQRDQVKLLAHTEPGFPQTWPDAPSIFPSYPCSYQAFVFEVFDHRNAPDYELGDIVAIDPTLQPSHDDWVLASLGSGRSLFFARYVLRGLDLQVEQLIEQLRKQGRDLIEKGVAELIDDAGPEKTRQSDRELIDKLRRGEYGETRDPPDAWLAPSRGPIVPFRSSEDRILGILIEHRRPRRGAEVFIASVFATQKVIDAIARISVLKHLVPFGSEVDNRGTYTHR